MPGQQSLPSQYAASDLLTVHGEGGLQGPQSETSPDKDELLSIVTNREMTKDDLDRALEIVRATDGIDFTKNKVEEYLDRARNVLPESIPEDVRAAYVMAADFIAGREF